MEKELELTSDECQKIWRAVISGHGRARDIQRNLKVEMRKILESRPNCQVGPNTFFPPQEEGDFETRSTMLYGLRRESPILRAAKYGKLVALKYFFTHFREVDVNLSGTCVIGHRFSDCDYMSNGSVHKCTALFAACFGSEVNINTVKFLVSLGASVNLPSCNKSTPLMGAVLSGKLDVVKYLVKHGANINSINLAGNSPLCFAAMGGYHKVIRFLIKKGADTSHKNIGRYTALHIAAKEGQLKAVKELLASGASPALSPVDSERPGYVPSPIIVAASHGNAEIVEFLLLRSCPPELKVDAQLLLGATYYEQGRKAIGFCCGCMRAQIHELQAKKVAEFERLWGEAMVLRDKFPACNYLPPVKAYGNYEEICTTEDWKSWKQSPLYSVDTCYQPLIIRERCMGYADLNTIQQLTDCCFELLRKSSRMTEAEAQWTRVMEMWLFFVESKPQEFATHFFMHTFYEKWVNLLTRIIKVGLVRLYPNVCEVNYRTIMEFIFRGLEILELPSLDPECRTPSPVQMVVYALLILCFWLHQQKAKDVEVQVFDANFESLSHKLVSKYLYLSDNHTILHILVENCKQFQIGFQQLTNLAPFTENVSSLLPILLRLGADEVVNVANSDGARPLHLAVMNKNPEMILSLVDSGAHLDAVNLAGETAIDLYHQRKDDLQSAEVEEIFCSSPLPLSCQACCKVLAEHFPYKEMDLPSHIKDFIKLHDKD